MIHKEFELVVANFIDLGDTGGEECLFNNDPNFPRLAFSPFNQPCSFSNFPLCLIKQHDENDDYMTTLLRTQNNFCTELHQ